MSRRVSSPRVVLVVGAVVGALSLAGCGAGQITQTDTQVSAVNGASADVGQIAVREATFPFAGNGKSAVIYPAGGAAPLAMTVVNFGGQDDKLTGVSSPVAASAKITGNATIAAGRVLLVDGASAGAAAPAATPAPGGEPATPAPAAPTRAPGAAPTVAAAAPTAGPSVAGTATAQVVLTGLKEDLKAGPAYPVVLTFQRAGEVTLQVPVANPGGGSTAE